MSEERYWKYLDGEMDQDEMSQFEALLRRDENSKQTFLELRSLHLKIREANVVKAPVTFKKNLLAKLIPEKPLVVHQPLISKGNWITAACVLIIITAAFTMMMRSAGFDSSSEWFYGLESMLDVDNSNLTTYLTWTIAVPFFFLLDRILQLTMKPKLSGYH